MEIKIQIAFRVMLICIFTYVNGQRLLDSKCSEYSQIPMNSSNSVPHIAVWSSMFNDDGGPIGSIELRRYVTLISDKFLFGNYIQGVDELDTILLDLRKNKIYFTPNDGHNVTEILTNKITDSRRHHCNIHKIVLIKINRISLDSNHRPACVWTRNDYLSGTVKFVQGHLIVYAVENDLPNHVLFDKVLKTSLNNVSYESRVCPAVNITRSFCFKIKRIDDRNWVYSHPPVLQSYKPFNFLPNNYYIYGIGNINRRTYYNLAINSLFDWIETSVWDTDVTTCGRATININPMILNSQPTLMAEFPWHAAIFYIEGIGRREYKCGGTLINEITVVTAAHCVSAPTGTLSHEVLVVILGMHDLNLHSLDSRETSVIAIQVHNSYNRHNFANDIALLKLRTLMPYTKYIQPICITKNKLLFENPIGVLPGWGVNEFNQPQAILAKASFPIRSQSECRGQGQTISAIALLVNQNTFCAGYQNGSSMCNGDSGGGLVFKVNDQWYIRGIASVGASTSATRQCDPFNLSLFTDVTQFYDWIVDGM